MQWKAYRKRKALKDYGNDIPSLHVPSPSASVATSFDSCSLQKVNEELKVKVVQYKGEIEMVDLQIMKYAVGDLKPHMEGHLQAFNGIRDETRMMIRERILGKYRCVRISSKRTITKLLRHTNFNMSLTPGFGYYKLQKIENVNLLSGVCVKEKGRDVYYDSLKRPGYKTARQALGLSEEVRYLIDPFFYENYDIFVKALSGNKQLDKNSEFLYQVWHHNHDEQCLEELFKAAKQGDLMGLVNDIPCNEEDEKRMFSLKNKHGDTVLHIAC